MTYHVPVNDLHSLEEILLFLSWSFIARRNVLNLKMKYQILTDPSEITKKKIKKNLTSIFKNLLSVKKYFIKKFTPLYTIRFLDNNSIVILISILKANNQQFEKFHLIIRNDENKKYNNLIYRILN